MVGDALTVGIIVSRAATQSSDQTFDVGSDIRRDRLALFPDLHDNLRSRYLSISISLRSHGGTSDDRQFSRRRDETRRAEQNAAGVVIRPLSRDRSPGSKIALRHAGRKGPRLTSCARQPTER